MRRQSDGPRLVVDLGATKVAWLTEKASSKHVAELPLPRLNDPEAEFGAIAAAISADVPVFRGTPVVAVAPIVLEGRVAAWPNRPYWVGFPLGRRLKDLFGTNAVTIPDGEAAAVADAGAGRRGIHISLFFGTGVAGGILIDRMPAPHGPLSAELGHIVTDPGGRTCTCGVEGCIQAAWIAYRNGLEPIEAFAVQLGRLARTLSRIFPRCSITLGGRFVQQDPLRAETLVQLVRARCVEDLWQPSVHLSRQGPNAPLRGGLEVARRLGEVRHVA